MGKENQTSSIHKSGEMETWVGTVDLSTAKSREINHIKYWEIADPYLQKAIETAKASGHPLNPATVARYKRQTVLIDQEHPLVRILRSDSSWLWRTQLPREYREAKESAGARKFLEVLFERAKKENKPDLAKEYEEELRRPGINPNGPLALRLKLRAHTALPPEYLLTKSIAHNSRHHLEPIKSPAPKTVDPQPRPRPESPYSHEESLARIHERMVREHKL